MGRREKDAGRQRTSRVDMSRFLGEIGLKGGTDSADSDSYYSEASEGVEEDLEPREPPSRKAAGGGEKPKSVFKVGQKVRVWWEPTTDKNRTGFAGAYWPAKIIQKATNKCKVEYDNGDDEWALVEHISPDSPPVDFGKEKKPLEVGEFCEVHNGSKTDPCAWLGRIAKIHPNGDYQIEYPFHDAKPEKMPVERVRRARVNEAGKWRLIKPHQTWASGEVTSPVELETIDERNLTAVMAEIAEELSGGQAEEDSGPEEEEEEEEKPQRSSSRSRGKPPSRPPSTVKKSSSKKKPKPESSSEEMGEEENDDSEDESEEEPPSTSRGRGRKAATPTVVKRSGRQRKPSAKVRSAEGDDSDEESEEPAEQSESEEEPEEEEPKPKKTPKATPKATPKSAAKSEEKPAPKRGRPAKPVKPEPKEEEEEDEEEEEEPEPEEEKPKPKRGRPPASAVKEKAPAAAAKRKSSDAEDSAPKQPRGGRKRKAPQVRK